MEMTRPTSNPASRPSCPSRIKTQEKWPNTLPTWNMNKDNFKKNWKRKQLNFNVVRKDTEIWLLLNLLSWRNMKGLSKNLRHCNKPMWTNIVIWTIWKMNFKPSTRLKKKSWRRLKSSWRKLDKSKKLTKLRLLEEMNNLMDKLSNNLKSVSSQGEIPENNKHQQAAKTSNLWAKSSLSKMTVKSKKVQGSRLKMRMTMIVIFEIESLIS